MKVVILAGGFGTRLSEYTNTNEILDVISSLSGKKMQDFNKIQFLILGFKYWVTKNYLIYRK